MKMQISVMPAWIAGIQVRRKRPEIHVSLDSSAPCWNEDALVRSTIESPEWLIFEGSHEEPRAAEPQPNSDCLTQRRKGAKGKQNSENLASLRLGAQKTFRES